MQSEKFTVRWIFLLLLAVGIITLMWPLAWTVINSSSNPKRETHGEDETPLDAIDDRDEISRAVPKRLISTRVAMIEKHMGRPLVVDPNMPYIGYLKPGEWRKYTLPEGIGIGRGSKGKQRNKFGTKNRKRGKTKGKPNKLLAHENKEDPNQLFFNVALDEGEETNVAAVNQEAALVVEDGDVDEEEKRENEEADGAGLDGDSFSSVV